MTAISSSDTATSTEAAVASPPGSFSQIPVPRVWTNGDSLDHGTLNKEWRDTFNWLLRTTAPAFEGYNNSGPTLTLNTAIPVLTEELKRGNITHAANDPKIYVWETGWYLAWVQIGALLTGVTGTSFASVLKINGAVATTSDVTRAAGTHLGVEHLSSVYLTAGDYVEMAFSGSWTGTVTAGGVNIPMIGLWWRSNA